MAPSPRDRSPRSKQPAEPKPSRDEPVAPKPSGDEPVLPRVRFVYQSKDKADKEFYSNWQMTGELLDKHVFGKVVPGELVARLEIEIMGRTPSELHDLDQTLDRKVDLLWRVPFRGSWLYLVILFEAQSTVDWRMPLRIMHETALVYQELSKDPEVRKHGKLPPVLPIVVYSGTRPWTAATSVEEMLSDEAQAFLPYALGQKYVLVEEAEEAKALTALDSVRDAALWLRYARSHEKYREAAAKLKELLPEASPLREAAVQWVRSRMIANGAKEEHVERVRALDDLESPVIETIWDRDFREEGREEGREQERRAMLVRLARRKFGSETAERLAALLEGVSDPERTEPVADLIIDCASGSDLLEQLERTVLADSVATSD